MECKRYKASEGKRLLNLESFGWGDTVLCGKDRSVSLIEVDADDAEYFQKRYQELTEDAYRDTRSEDEVREVIDGIRAQLLQEIEDKGYSMEEVEGEVES